VELARRLAAEKQITNASFDRMEAESLTVEDDEFDVVLCALGLMYVTNPVESAREMLRALKPGGRAVVAVWGPRSCSFNWERAQRWR
jgi:ubiquinone/menaquinone biosynthesis C-methylase UbiE